MHTDQLTIIHPMAIASFSISKSYEIRKQESRRVANFAE